MVRVSKGGRKTSIFKLLNLSVGSLVLLTFLSIVISLVAISFVKRSVSVFVESTLPIISLVSEIKVQNQFISDALPKLRLIETSDALDHEVARLAEANRVLVDTLTRLEEKNTPETSNTYFNRPVDLPEFTRQIENVLRQRIELNQAKRHSEKEILKKIKTIISLLDMEIIDMEYQILLLEEQKQTKNIHNRGTPLSISTLQYALQDLHKLKSEVETLPFFIGQANSATAMPAIIASRNEFDIKLRSASVKIAQFSDVDTKARIAKDFMQLYELHHATGGYYTNQVAIAETEEKIAKLQQRIVDYLEKVNSDISRVLESSHARSRDAISSMLDGTKLTLLLLILVALLVVLSAIYIFKFVIKKRVSIPLKSVTEEISRISNGREYSSEHSTIDTSSIELEDIDRSLIGFSENALKLRERDRELTKKNKELDKINENLRTFTRVSSHDLKSPLRGIRVLCDVARDAVEENDVAEVERSIERIDGRVARLDKLLTSLLEYTKGKRQYEEPTDVNVTNIIQQQHEILDKSHVFGLAIETSFTEIRTREVPFAMIIRNLLDNAIKHHDKDCGKIVVTFRALDEKHYELNIEDDGPGILPEYQARVFQPFETLKPKDQVEGAGMGLAIISKIAEDLGGRISLSSPIKHGRGCRFTLLWQR